MIIEIKNRYTDVVIYSAEVDDDESYGVRTAVIEANRSCANLCYAKLSGADLGDANLGNANLSEASLLHTDLSGANLFHANLTSANLFGANLSHVDFVGANFSDTNLSNANLSHANFHSADLCGANLRGASLYGANLRDAYLIPIQDDLCIVLDTAPAEVAGLLAAIDSGRIDGSAYEGACACLVGTIANLRGCAVGELSPAITPNPSRPAERWFLGISRGDTPDNNPIAAITRDWIVSWQTERVKNKLIAGK